MTVTQVKCEESDAFKGLELFGRFQSIQYFLICLPLVLVSMTHMNYIFVAEDVAYRCRVPECESDSDSNTSVEKPLWWPKDTAMKCSRPALDIENYMANNGTCTNSSFLEILEECNEWIYENNNSIVSGLNLGCESWKATLVGSVHNAGMIFSMMLIGWIADKIGRKPSIIICSVGGSVGVLKIFVRNYYAYITLEFLESFLASGLYTVGVVLLIEVGGDTKRVLAGVIFSYAVYVGEVLFAFLAMGLHYWKSLILVVYTPLLLFVFYGFVLNEGTRWQMLRGRTEEAKQTFKLMAKMNKLNISPKEIDDISEENLRTKINVQVQKEKENIKNILGSREIMIRLAVASFCFFTSSFLYYGMVVHSVLLPGNKYMNFVLASLTAFPGDMLAFYTFNKYGRRITLQYGYFFSAVFLIAQTYSPDSMPWVKLVLFLSGKLGVVMCFTGTYTYSLELFPTSVRGSLVGCGNTAARIGGMLAPLTPLLATQMSALPTILFATLSLTSAVLLSFTPETKTLPMFDTIAQIEAYKANVITRF